MMSILELEVSNISGSEYKLELKIRQLFYYLDICHETSWLFYKNKDPLVGIIIDYCGTT
jgi:hypothetical protein